MGQTSIPCTSEVRDDLAELKADFQSWSEFLRVLAEHYEAGEVDAEMTVGVTPTLDEAALERLTERVDEAVGETDTAALADLRDALATIEERTGRIERLLEDMGGRR